MCLGLRHSSSSPQKPHLIWSSSNDLRCHESSSQHQVFIMLECLFKNTSSSPYENAFLFHENAYDLILFHWLFSLSLSHLQWLPDLARLHWLHLRWSGESSGLCPPHFHSLIQFVFIMTCPFILPVCVFSALTTFS